MGQQLGNSSGGSFPPEVSWSIKSPARNAGELSAPSDQSLPGRKGQTPLPRSRDHTFAVSG